MQYRAMEGNVEHLRPPGLLEQWSTVRHDLGFYSCVGMTGRYHPPAPASLSPPILYGALRFLISKHAALGTSIIGEFTPTPTFIRLPEIDLQEIAEFVQLDGAADREAVLSSIISTRHAHQFSDLGRLPLWRIVALFPPESQQTDQGIDICLFIHHGIADGGGATTFHRDLLVAFNSAVPSEAVVTVPCLALPAPLESQLSLPISWTTLVRAVFADWFSSSSPALWTGAPVTNVPAVQAGHISLTFPPATVAGLLTVCRKNGVTVTALIEALVAKALFDALPTDGTADELTCTCPINLRRFIPAIDDTVIGVFFAGSTQRFARAEADDIWGVARRVKKELHAKLAAGNRDLNVGLIRYISDVHAHFQKQLGKARGESFEVSNPGVVDGNVGGDGWRMTRLGQSQSPSVAGAAVEFSVCSVRGGDMSISTDWQMGVVEEAVVRRVTQAISASMAGILEV